MLTVRVSLHTCGLLSLGPEKHTWAPDGSATHQEMLIRIFYDGNETPGVEVPFGDFANCFGKRSEVINLPVIVEDADSYNCFGTCLSKNPFA